MSDTISNLSVAKNVELLYVAFFGSAATAGEFATTEATFSKDIAKGEARTLL